MPTRSRRSEILLAGVAVGVVDPEEAERILVRLVPSAATWSGGVSPARTAERRVTRPVSSSRFPARVILVGQALSWAALSGDVGGFLSLGRRAWGRWEGRLPGGPGCRGNRRGLGRSRRELVRVRHAWTFGLNAEVRLFGSLTILARWRIAWASTEGGFPLGAERRCDRTRAEGCCPTCWLNLRGR